MKNIQSIVESLGYSPREATIYLSLLTLGQSTAAAVAQHAGLNRVTTYTILERLVGQRLVTRGQSPRSRLYAAVDPSSLLRDTQQRTAELESILPLLHQLSAPAPSRPTVQQYEGLLAVQRAYQLSLDASTEICNYANSAIIRDHWPEYDHDYVAQRCARGIFLRCISPRDPHGQAVLAADAQFHRQTRLIDPQLFNADNEVMIWDQSVLIVSFAPQTFAIHIQSPAVADTQRQIFEMLW